MSPTPQPPNAFDLKGYYDRLKRLFATGNSPVRQRVAHKVAPPGQTGSPVGTARAFLRHTTNSYASQLASYGQYSRLARYSDYNEMESMAEIGSALDIYADETCSKGEYGDIIKIESSNEQIRKSLTDLFYDVLNIEFNAWTWIRNLCKYGDQFLLVDHHPDYGVLGALPMPVNEIEREEGWNPEDPTQYRYRWVTQGNRIMENWQVVHFRLLGNDNYLPYGSSILEPARRVWRQLILLEDAVMVYRIVRSPERRVFYVGVGNISPQEIPQYVQKVMTQLKRNQVVDESTGRVDLRYNALSTDEDYIIPVRGEGDGTRIETLPGGHYTGDIEDLIYIQNKLFAALKIPKSYLGYEGDVGSKSTLSQEDVRFSRTIQRIQRVFIAELNKLAIIHLYSMGYEAEDLLNFTITMANPSSIAELQRLELWRAKFEVASLAQQGHFDTRFVRKNLYRLSDEEIEAIEQGLRKDKLFELEIEAIQLPALEGQLPPEEEEGTPPAGGGGSADLPPPPGEFGAEPGINASKDPNIQSAAPNDLLKPQKPEKPKFVDNPDSQYNHAFGWKKTAMDPKRNYSELSRWIKAPFGEQNEPDAEKKIAERQFERHTAQLRGMAERLKMVPGIKVDNKLLNENDDLENSASDNEEE